MAQPWLYGAILLLLVHGALLVSAHRSRQRRGKRDSGHGQSEEQSGRVVCAHCDEVNENRYRYYRQCVSELPVNEWAVEDDAPPQGRRTL